MRRIGPIAAVGLFLLLTPTVVLACLWDYDTLKMETQQFPTTLELITGKFLRHSKEFYQWRIQDRLTKLKHYPDRLDYYDDLAVAYDKTGQHQQAIETILKKDKLKPGLYETEANLGTFYVHAGELEKGLEHIKKAIAINPDAHFGREKYQMHLVEYVLSRRQNGKISLPLAKIHRLKDTGPIADLKPDEVELPVTFARSLMEPDKPNYHGLNLEERRNAVKGVLGMMKFGKHDSPILLEALGDLLSGTYDRPDALRLAARAYLKASYEVEDKEAKELYRLLAKKALCQQRKDAVSDAPLTLEVVEQRFQQELHEADQWYAELRENERRWIREGKDPEQEFDKLYTREPEVTVAEDLTFRKLILGIASACLLGINGVLLLVVGIVLLRRRIRSAWKPQASA